MTRMISPHHPTHTAECAKRTSVADWLDDLAVASGDGAFHRAANFLRERRVGRPEVDDSPHLDEMMFLLEGGHARSIEEAARHVAAALSGEHSVEATTRRLARKFRLSWRTKLPRN